MTRTIFVAAALALAITLPAAPAQAGASRTFVSGAGSDTNPCSFIEPCRSLQIAYNATAAEGEIDVLDPAGYGALTISQGISIEGHGWASMPAASGGAAITINGGDKINIRGVVLDGGGVANTTGIQFTSGTTLNVQDSVIRNFTQTGITFQPSASTSNQIAVSNTVITGVNDGIDIFPTGSGAVIGVLDHVDIENLTNTGLNVSNNTGTIKLTVNDSVIADGYDGITATSGGGILVNIMVRNSTIANNSNVGVATSNTGANISVTRSTITGNDYAWTLYGGGTPQLTSYGDNNIDGNTNNNTTLPNTASYK
jgi:hypothetical protein